MSDHPPGVMPGHPPDHQGDPLELAISTNQLVTERDVLRSENSQLRDALTRIQKRWRWVVGCVALLAVWAGYSTYQWDQTSTTVGQLSDNNVRTNCRAKYTDPAQAAQGQAFVDILGAVYDEVTGAEPIPPEQARRDFRILVETTKKIQSEFLLRVCGRAK